MKNGFCIIGGFSELQYYGYAESYEGAKRIATANVEWMGSFLGWQKPVIYRACDCVFSGDGSVVETTNDFYASWNEYTHRWDVLDKWLKKEVTA